ncbi:MAG: VOC family protein [Planctomycetota bacterium]
MDIQGLDHVALHIEDLDRSRQFYEEVLGLRRAVRPDFDFPGEWYRVGDQQIHLIGRPVEGSVPKERHYALTIADVAAAQSRLEAHGISYGGPKPRPDGRQQIFVRDPDGHVIELLGPPPGPDSR